MFDDFFERPPPEYRLSRILIEGFEQSRSPWMRGVINAAIEQLETYQRERDNHKYGSGPPPRPSLLREAFKLVAEAGQMMRSMRESRGGYALAKHQGIDIAFVTDELWQSSDAIWRWIEYERTRWESPDRGKRPMRRAVPLETVRKYVEEQLSEYEPVYEHEMELGERGPIWPIAFPRYVFLYWLHLKALGRAERAGVGAVLAEDTGPELLEQLGLLGEQLRVQDRNERSGEALVGTVPSDLTQDAVPVFWTSQTSISASAEGWRRRCGAERRAGAPAKPRAESSKRALIDLEHRMLQTKKALGGSKPEPNLEAVNRYVEHAGGRLTNWRALYNSEETDERDLYEQLDRARTAAYAAVGACREAGNPVDPDELQAIADEIQQACRRSLERRLWELNAALGGSNPHRGVEAVHGHAERAACHVAACRVLREWGTDEREPLEKLENAREAAHAAVAACPGDPVPALDRVDLHEIAVELKSIATALDAEVEQGREAR